MRMTRTTATSTQKLRAGEKTMRYFGWITAGALSVALFSQSQAIGADAPKKLGVGESYMTLASLPVLHQGRIKPLDTVAREEIKQVFGRETIKLLNEKNEVHETWGAVAALFDWSVRPEFWDDQPILLVEYLPLKRLILADAMRTKLNAIAAKETSAADREALKKLAGDKELSGATLIAFAAKSSLAASDKAIVDALGNGLAEEHKWVSPRQLEESKIAGESARSMPFDMWFQEVVAKKRKADASPNGEIKLTEVEKRGYELGTRLVHYQAVRDRSIRSVEPLLVMPRPYNTTHLAFLKKVYEKGRKEGIEGLTPLEIDSVMALKTFWQELSTEDRKLPTTDPEFDKEFTGWLRDSSVWVPLRVILEAKPEEIEQSGFPAYKVAGFVTAFKDLDRAETDAPGTVSEAKASAFLAAARALGEETNATAYPSVSKIRRETTFNSSAPFSLAWPTYFCAALLLAASLGFEGMAKTSWLSSFGRKTYGIGILALMTAIGLEINGFYYRVRITGWAPVTNMYETVVWVSLFSAMLGLIFEAKFRKTYTALAGSGVALLGTLLAANVPLLDPNIHQLQPVLRSNYWLTIHVLTEVSSYGAFLLAAVLGLIATIYYIKATYRRSPTFTELALLLVPGLPLLAVGTLGLMAAAGQLGPTWVTGSMAYLISATIACAGIMFTTAAMLAMVGEVVARFQFGDQIDSEDGLLANETRAHASLDTTPRASKPSVAEIRSMATLNPVKLDARGRSMQETANTIKPLANFIYRTMQVGVLLIAAGTILGGIWADASWGRFWGWDPKEVWALITLLVYLIPLHGRFAGWFNTFALVVASVVCSLSVIMAWYGVNFILGVGLHAYGFVEGGGQFSVFGVLAAMMAFPVAAAWRRRCGSMVSAAE